MNNKLSKKIAGMLLNYIGNRITAHTIIEDLHNYYEDVNEEAIINIIGEANSEWLSAPCDDEGPTQEQDAELERILNDAANSIIKQCQYTQFYNITKNGVVKAGTFPYEDAKLHLMYAIADYEEGYHFDGDNDNIYNEVDKKVYAELGDTSVRIDVNMWEIEKVKED